ncbi:hypothetical protein [Aeromonas schubertii]|nr:hypothetical protein [Aeromonas schubertii]
MTKDEIRMLLGNVTPQQLPNVVMDLMINRHSNIEEQALQDLKVACVVS